jgi:Fe-S-cluster containining protein
VESLEDELERAHELAVEDLADAIEAIGFECTHCGACCKGDDPEDDAEREPHTATVFPEEARRIRDGLNDEVEAGSAEHDPHSDDERGDGAETRPYDWRDVARPTPYGLREGPDGPAGETFEWALAVDDCGDCTFYDEDAGEEAGGGCTIYGDRPLVCRTYPFSVALGGVDEPLGEVVDSTGVVRAHECEGLGRDVSREDAEALAATLKKRAVREIAEAIAVRESYDPVETDERVVVHDSEGAKRSDGSALDRE